MSRVSTDGHVRSIVLLIVVVIRAMIVFVIVTPVGMRLLLLLSWNVRWWSLDDGGGHLTRRLHAHHDAVQPVLVTSQMQFQIGGLSELPIAIGHAARVGLFAGVQALVGLQMRLLFKSFIADVANEATDVVVDEHVLRQQTPGAEYLVTDLASDIPASRRRRLSTN